MKNHIIQDENNKDTILYEDRDKRRRLISERVSDLPDLEFIIKKSKNYLEGEEQETFNMLPSLTILGKETKAMLRYDIHSKTTQINTSLLRSY